MIDTATLDTSSIERLFVIANTPIFLIDEIRKDGLTRALSLRTDDELIECLERATNSPPTNVSASTIPFLILAALSLKDPPSGLLRSKSINPASCDPWFDFGYLRQTLIERATTTKYSTWKQDVSSPETAPKAKTSYLILP